MGSLILRHFILKIFRKSEHLHKAKITVLILYLETSKQELPKRENVRGFDQIKTQDIPTSNLITATTPSYPSSALADKESTKTRVPASQIKNCSSSGSVILIKVVLWPEKTTRNILSVRWRHSCINMCCSSSC